ncbi:ERF family protein [Gimesia algae]|uniref:ERF superfamily protein n=1 Tax=Gimesia algae TaxID=2527971 RepID=A0A517VMF2_9PLAN|nr:ERF family protein [Gimesia algae]QDT94186.1 ERF superfamily protein [Gimesia algae]
MNKSDTVTELSAALAKAQAGIANAAKEGVNANPHFKHNYATLKSVWAVCKIPLTENGLSVVQSPEFDGQSVKVTTTLLHKTGQWIESTITMPVKKLDCQGIGSAITYARRYALAAMVGVAPDGDDDDGEAAVNHHQKTQQPANQQQTQQQQQRQPAQQQTQGEKTDSQKVNAFLKAANCQSKEDADLVLDFVAPGHTTETVKNPEIASFVLASIKDKLNFGLFKPETVLGIARAAADAADAF